jgi:Flp pilus assembly protein TadG
MTRRPVGMMRAAPVLAKIRALWGDSDGSALVEATIITPLLVSLFLGVLEFSWYFYNQQLVVAGLRDAARYMTRIELTNGNSDPCAQKDQNGVLYTAKAASTRPPPCPPPAARPGSAVGMRPTSQSTAFQAPRSATAATPTA